MTDDLGDIKPNPRGVEEKIVYISYAEENYDKAKKLYDALKSEVGVKPWLRKEDILPGQNIGNEIEKAIKNSRYFIALISKSINRTGPIQKELKYALDKQREFPESDVYLIPIRLEDCIITDSKLENIQDVDLFHDWDRGLNKILQAMNLEQINRQEEILTKQPNIDKIKSSIENSLINRELVVGLPEKSRTMLSTYESFVTMRMPLNWSYRAPDGSYIWKLPDVRGAGLCKCILPAYHVSTAQRHKTVDEIWYFVSGHGRLWRKRDDDRKGEVVDVESGLSVTIPVGTYFQFKNTGGSDLVVLILTSPIWPGPQEAEYVENYWQLVK